MKDTDKLDSLIEKTGAKKQGEVAGATVYQDQDTSFAVDDDVVVLAGSRELLDAALKRADGGESLRGRLRQGPRGPARRRARAGVRGRAGPARQSEDAAAARKIEWVDALRTLGLTVSAERTRSTSSSTCAPTRTT